VVQRHPLDQHQRHGIALLPVSVARLDRPYGGLLGFLFLPCSQNPKVIIMSFDYFDCITIAANSALDIDLPPELLPLTIANEAALLAGLDSDRMGSAAWA